MDPFKSKATTGPESIIQAEIENMLRIKGWFVMRTHGSAYQAGFPDNFACHKLYRQRWIEIKLPGMVGSKFMPSQLEVFPKLCANGSGVWVLTAATEEEYRKLFEPPNWAKFLNCHSSYGLTRRSKK